MKFFLKKKNLFIFGVFPFPQHCLNCKLFLSLLQALPFIDRHICIIYVLCTPAILRVKKRFTITYAISTDYISRY